MARACASFPLSDFPSIRDMQFFLEIHRPPRGPTHTRPSNFCWRRALPTFPPWPLLSHPSFPSTALSAAFPPGGEALPLLDGEGDTSVGLCFGACAEFTIGPFRLGASFFADYFARPQRCPTNRPLGDPTFLLNLRVSTYAQWSAPSLPPITSMPRSVGPPTKPILHDSNLGP